MALLLLAQNATVTMCHSKTIDLPAVTSRADVLIAAIGKARMITANMVKEGAVVIDVGVRTVWTPVNWPAMSLLMKWPRKLLILRPSRAVWAHDHCHADEKHTRCRKNEGLILLTSLAEF